MSNSSWSDGIRIHEATNLFPMMPENELDELAADIAVHGLRQPIAVIEREGGFALLDGRNRIAAVQRIANQQRREQLLRQLWNGGYTIRVLPNEDPLAYVASANLHRRHLTAQQRHAAIAAVLRSDASRSDRAIAKSTHASPSTVANIRQELERDGTVSKLDTRVGADGVSQPASKPRGGRKARLVPDERVNARAAGGSADTQKKLSRDQLIVGFAALLHRRLGDTLLDLHKLLAHEHAEIAKLPVPKRIDIARHFCEALGVTSEDLHRVEDRA